MDILRPFNRRPLPAKMIVIPKDDVYRNSALSESFKLFFKRAEPLSFDWLHQTDLPQAK